MNIRIESPVKGGTIEIPASKSVTHRLLITDFLERVQEGTASCLSPQNPIICHGQSHDIRATCRCLDKMGKWLSEYDFGRRCCRAEDFPLLDCGDSASTYRFLQPICAALKIPGVFTGSRALLSRPVEMPYEYTGPGEYLISGGVSSQFITGLLFALPLEEKDSRIVIDGKLESAPYVDMTIGVLESFGIRVKKLPSAFEIAGNQRYRKTPEAALLAEREGDWTHGALWLSLDLAMRLLNSGDFIGIAVNGLDESSLQGDRKITDFMGLFLEKQGAEEIVIDISAVPDLAPALAVAAVAGSGRTRLTGAGRLRIKESDRLAGIGEIINILGGRAEALEDELLITGSGGEGSRVLLKGGTVNPLGDHRLAMMAGALACFCDEEVTVLHGDCVEKSYPDFWRDYERLGGKISVQK